MTVLALVEPNTLTGTELRQALRQRRDLWNEVRLLSAEVDPEVATLSELDGVDLLFVCADYDAATPPLPEAAASTTTILISPRHRPDGSLTVVSGVNLAAAAAGGVLVSPHPAVVLLALLLDPLRPLGLSEAAAWLVQPATMRGRRGMDELMEQTRALLAFANDKPIEVFGQQLAFNLLPTDEEAAPLADEVAHLLAGTVRPALEILQGAVFHGFTASVLVGFAEDPGATAIQTALEARPLIRRHDPESDPGHGPITAAGADKVILGAVSPVAGQPGRYWLRAVMDNLTRGGAINALEIAASVLG